MDVLNAVVAAKLAEDIDPGRNGEGLDLQVARTGRTEGGWAP